MKPKALILVLLILSIMACTTNTGEIITRKEPAAIIKQSGEPMRISSPEFNNNSPIPSIFTCDGSAISPELKIENVPLDTKSLALIVDDPDAPRATFTHWIIWNIPPEITLISQDEQEYSQGTNDFGNIGYGAPCPPSGAHRYFFKVYALDKELDLPETANKNDIVKAMQGHIIATAELIGNYKKE